MKMHIRHFTLIEILLAIALIAFGVVVILGMLPCGLRTSSNIAAQSYAGETVDQVLAYLARQTLKDPIVQTTEVDVSNYAGLLQCNSDLKASEPGNFKRTGLPGLYGIGTPDGSGLFTSYVIIQGNADSGRVDFAALVRVWTSDWQYPDHSGSGSWEKTYSNSTGSNEDEEKKYQLNIEISWPLSKEYAARTKRYYCF